MSDSSFSNRAAYKKMFSRDKFNRVPIQLRNTITIRQDSPFVNSLELAHAKARTAYNLAAQKYHDLFSNELNEKEYDRNLLDAFARRFTDNSVICDVGCGPSAHIGRYLHDKGITVVGVDISDQCVKIARRCNPGMRVEQGDAAGLPFDSESFDGVISYYSIIHSPKNSTHRIFDELSRILKPGGSLLVAVKAGTSEGYVTDLLGIKTEIYFSLFTEREIAQCFDQARFEIEVIEKRNPYDFEIQNERIFAVGRKALKQTGNR